jgi:tetratricopeptide (TPR) repeat protein
VLYDEAIIEYDRCIELLERLLRENKLDDENDLASAYLNRGNAYSEIIGCTKEALADYDRCIEIMERLLGENKLFDENGLADAYMNRGLAYEDICEDRKAHADFKRYDEIWERLNP